VKTNELIYAILMAALLLGLGGYVGWRQWRTLRGLRSQGQLSTDERRYQRTLAWRRLVGSGLMVILAGLLIGSYWLDRERQAQELSLLAHGQDAPPTEEHKQFLTLYITYWIIFGLGLLGLVCLAFIDIWAIYRFGRRNLRQIQADRRAMIEHQVAEYRRQRNGL
jgi:hypothetical protein